MPFGILCQIQRGREEDSDKGEKERSLSREKGYQMFKWVPDYQNVLITTTLAPIPITDRPCWDLRKREEFTVLQKGKYINKDG